VTYHNAAEMKVFEAGALLEMDLMGAMISDPAIAQTACEILNADHFMADPVAIAFDIAQDMVRKDGRISLQILAARCAQQEHGPGSADIASWVSGTTIVRQSVMSAIDAIIDGWARRSLLDASYRAGEAVSTGEAPADISRILMDECDAIQSARARRTTAPQKIGDIAELAMRSASSAYEHGGQRVEISAGIKDIDRRTNGLRRKELVLIGGRPSMGKTVLVTSIIRQAAHAGHGCALFSLEMSSESITTRMLSDEAFGFQHPTKYTDIFAGQFDRRQWDALADAQQRMAQLPIIIDEQRGLTVSEIGSRARRIRQQLEEQGKRLDILAIDYLGLVRPSSTYRGNRVNEIGEISAGLKQLAQDLDCCVLCLQQLSRGVEMRENKRPTLADLRDSGTLEQDADLVGFVYRDEYYAEREEPTTDSEVLLLEDRLEKARHKLEFIIAKQRNGPVGTVELWCDVAFAAVRNLAR